jgi:GNAT superfamily N-acetyltransferase
MPELDTNGVRVARQNLSTGGPLRRFRIGVDVELTPVRTTDDTPERWFRVLTPTFATDYPGLHPQTHEFVVGGMRYPTPGEQPYWWLASVEGADVGGVSVNLPLVDNTDAAMIEVFVAQEYRRRGIGDHQMRHALDFAANAGRQRQITSVAQEFGAKGPPAVPFLERHGFQQALHELISHVNVTALDESALAALEVDARRGSSEYDVETWVGPPLDDDTSAQLGYLEGTLSEDAPLGDTEWQRENWDAARVRLAHENLKRMGVVSLHAVARDRVGHVVAWTHLVSEPSEPTWAMQWETVVHPAHRGHRLGAAIKLANLAQLREQLPAVQRIETSNAAENEHMLRVNRAMGFVAVGHLWEYKRR